MRPISLNIGPSEVSEAVRRDLVEIAGSDLLSESHRGPVVQQVLKDAAEGIRAAMRVPDDFAVVFQPSATAGMETLCRNLATARSFHFVDGAFSGRMATTAAQVGLDAVVYERPWDASPPDAPPAIPDDVQLITLAHNETSTGRQWPWDGIRALREAHPEALLAVDVTSSFGAMHMDWTLADAWFGSVQKCLGLPSGLGFLLVSARALARAEAIGDARHVVGWQDLPSMAARIGKGETQETPNVILFALLARQMARWDLDAVHEATHAKAARLDERIPEPMWFIRDPAWRSRTSHCLVVPDPAVARARLREAGFVIGSGYGPLKETCLRMATFPSVGLEDVERALDVLLA